MLPPPPLPLPPPLLLLLLPEGCGAPKPAGPLPARARTYRAPSAGERTLVCGCARVAMVSRGALCRGTLDRARRSSESGPLDRGGQAT